MDRRVTVGCVLALCPWVTAALAAQVGRPSDPEVRSSTLISGTVLEGPGSDIGVIARNLPVRDRGALVHAGGRGVLLERVAPRSPAERAGLQAGDIVTELDRVSVIDAKHFRQLVHDTPPGRAIWAVYVRDGVTRRVVVLPQIVRPS